MTDSGRSMAECQHGKRHPSPKSLWWFPTREAAVEAVVESHRKAVGDES